MEGKPTMCILCFPKLVWEEILFECFWLYWLILPCGFVGFVLRFSIFFDKLKHVQTTDGGGYYDLYKMDGKDIVWYFLNGKILWLGQTRLVN